jgi:hypothetical protein
VSTPSKNTGPLTFPPAPASVRWGQLADRLRGHTTSVDWLPEGLWPELDSLRVEHQRLRGQVAAELDGLAALDSKNLREDAQHADALRQAHREGTPNSVKDERTPTEERAAARAAIEERLWAGVQVLAEHADRIIEAFREHEDEWLGDLRSRRAAAEEKRHQAEQLLEQARAEEFRVHRLGQWLQAQSDDDPLYGRQPAPALTDVPEHVAAEAYRDALERPWHKIRDWAKTPMEA